MQADLANQTNLNQPDMNRPYDDLWRERNNTNHK
jgi:hypothetical protein